MLLFIESSCLSVCSSDWRFIQHIRFVALWWIHCTSMDLILLVHHNQNLHQCTHPPTKHILLQLFFYVKKDILHQKNWYIYIYWWYCSIYLFFHKSFFKTIFFFFQICHPSCFISLWKHRLQFIFILLSSMVPQQQTCCSKCESGIDKTSFAQPHMSEKHLNVN